MTITRQQFTEFEHSGHMGHNGHDAVVDGIEGLLELNAPLTVRLVSRVDEFDELEHYWKQLVKRPDVKATIFQTFEWQRLWWRYFGQRRQLHIITIWDADRLVGIVPFFVDTISILGMVEYRELKLLGSEVPGSDSLFSNYSPTDYLDVILDPEYRDQLVESVLTYLKRSQTLFDHIVMNELSSEGTFMKLILPEMINRQWDFKKLEREPCPGIELPATVEEYLGNLDRKVRYELRYSKRAVTEKELIRVTEVSDESELDKAFQQFVNLHQERWNKQGLPGIFIDSDYKDFLKEIGRAFIREGYLKFTLAFDKSDNCIAVDFAFIFKDEVYDYQKAFDIESELAKYSPGRALLYFLIEDSIEKGLKKVDLLRGGERYKLKVTNTEPRNWKLVIPNPERMNGLKHRLFRAYQLKRSMSDRFKREWLLVRVHFRQFGFPAFLSRYSSFIKQRIQERFKH